jgi:hypothetical protein
LITAETLASSEPLLHQPPFFCSHFGCMQNVNHCSRSANN